MVAKKEGLATKEAKHGQKMIEVKIRFGTNLVVHSISQSGYRADVLVGE